MLGVIPEGTPVKIILQKPMEESLEKLQEMCFFLRILEEFLRKSVKELPNELPKKSSV